MNGRCSYIVKNTPYSPGFEFVKYFPTFNLTKALSTTVRQRVKEPPSGDHYYLVPRKKMLLSDYEKEVKRLYKGGVKCAWEARATDQEVDWPKEYMEPSDVVMRWVARALFSMSKSPDQDEDWRFDAGMAYTTICALNMAKDDVLINPALTRMVLKALENYDTNDLEGQSACYYMAQCIWAKHDEVPLEDAFATMNINKVSPHGQDRHTRLIGVHAQTDNPDHTLLMKRCSEAFLDETYSSLSPLVLSMYVTGSVCFVLEVDAARFDAVKDLPLPKILVDGEEVQADRWYEFTDVLVDDVEDAPEDTAIVVAEALTPGPTLQFSVPKPDVDTVFGSLPRQCTAQVARERRRCKNRCFNTHRCYCHKDTSKYKDFES